MPSVLQVPHGDNDFGTPWNNLDSERIALTTIQQIGEIDVKLAQVLSRLAENFDYPAILNTLDETSGE